MPLMEKRPDGGSGDEQSQDCPVCGLEYDEKEDHEDKIIFTHNGEDGDFLYSCTHWKGSGMSDINPEK